jgi:hypothetical protein
MKIYKKEGAACNATVEVLETSLSLLETIKFQITDFVIVSHAGQIIQYKVTPLLGITISWMTEISFVKENRYFVDEQRFGLCFMASQTFF